MCIYGVQMCICIANMKFLCLTQCQGEVFIDDDDDDNADDNDDDDGQFMIV